MVDLSKDFGCMVELYGNSSKVLPMMVEHVAKDWDGVTDPIIPMQMG